jgi:peptidoglycan/LPS O-acetylase OafA/YrhL
VGYAGEIGAEERGGLSLPQLPARLGQIDLLKGLAIIAVLFLHGLPVAALTDGATVFYIGQAVPVLVVLMGVNATASMWRNGHNGLRHLYSRHYGLSRIDRLYVPFLFVLALSSLTALAKGTLTPGGIVSGLLGGTLPYSGPGNYFVTFAFEFAVALPAFYWAYRRAPTRTVVAGFAVAAAFELAAPHIGVFDTNPFVYSAALPRFIPFFALGAVLADYMLHGQVLPRWWWIAGLISTVYLLVVHMDANAFPLADNDWRRWGQTFASAFYPALLVVLGLHWLPRRPAHMTWRLVTQLGVASYEIFLLQILWFSLVAPPSFAKLIPSIVVCCLLGVAFHRMLDNVPRLSARETVAR